MKKRDRERLKSIYGNLYEFDPMGERLKCAYCGDTRESVDHIPPLSVVDGIGTKELYKKGISLVTVPCCLACNNALGSKKLATFGERLLFIYGHLQDRLERKSFWSDEELNELGRNLKRMVIARQMEIRRNLIARLRGVEYRLCRLDEKVDAEAL